MSEPTIIVWKSTKADGSPTHGKKSLPKPRRGRPGAWHDTGGDPVFCERGVHGCRTLADMLRGGWLHERLWVAELRAPFEEEPGNKIAGQSGRLLYPVDTWNEQTARLFACDAAESVVSLATSSSSANAILVSRRYAFGLSTDAELTAARDAARNAAWDAARDAAWTAAWTAAWSAARDAARSAAWYAAWSAAWTAARDAAWDAAWDVHINKLALRLHEYLRGEVDIEAIRAQVTP